MFRILAITLDETRMSKMREIWKGVESFPGISNPKPYLGCNLAHIAAVREGLKNGESHVLILEDDARPKESVEAVYDACREMAKYKGWDVLSLCACADFKVKSEAVVARQFLKGIYSFEASRQFVNMDAIFWSREALPLLDEFEELVKEGTNFLPIDLMIYNNNWSTEIEGSEPCQIKHLREINGVKFWPPNLTWNHPRTLIAWPSLTYQSSEYISSHTGNQTPDYSLSNLNLDVRLKIDKIPENTRKLDFVIGSSRQVTEIEECG